MHIPLLIRVPGVTSGTSTDALVESIDLYPTLSELCGLDAPKHLEGRSVVPLLKNTSDRGKGFAIGRYKQGDTLRTDHFRYTEYSQNDGTMLGRMLYDHRIDAEEDHNVVDKQALSGEIGDLGKLLNDNKGKGRKKPDKTR
jgi:arylsulfatase A-like enzyme